MMKILKISLNVCKYILIGILAAVLLFNLIGIIKRVFFKEQVPLIFGFGYAVVESGSMEPAIKKGDIIIVRKKNDYNVKDIVTYKSKGSKSTTHRIIEKNGGKYITQGDANNAADEEIDKSLVIGKVVNVVSGAGKIISFFGSPFGALILLLGLFAAVELPALLKKR